MTSRTTQRGTARHSAATGTFERRAGKHQRHDHDGQLDHVDDAGVKQVPGTAPPSITHNDAPVKNSAIAPAITYPNDRSNSEKAAENSSLRTVWRFLRRSRTRR